MRLLSICIIKSKTNESQGLFLFFLPVVAGKEVLPQVVVSASRRVLCVVVCVGLGGGVGVWIYKYVKVYIYMYVRGRGWVGEGFSRFDVLIIY